MLSCAKWFVTSFVVGAQLAAAQSINLSTSKQIHEPVPGSPVRLNSLPMGVAWSPDHRYLAMVNAGFGTVDSNYSQSIAIVDTAGPDTGGKPALPASRDFPDRAPSLAPARRCTRGSPFRSTEPASVRQHRFADGIPKAVMRTTPATQLLSTRFANGELTPERLIPIPLQHLAAGPYPERDRKAASGWHGHSGSHRTRRRKERGREGADPRRRRVFR